MKSKQLMRKHAQPLFDRGMTQREFAALMGIKSRNFVSMLKRDNYNNVLSLNRLSRFAEVCGLTPRETIQLALARVEDANGEKVELTKETLCYLLKTFVRVVDEHRAARGPRTLLGAV